MATIDERIEEIAVNMNGLTLAMKAIAQAHLELAQKHIEHEDAISRLALIVANHEDRLDTLEGNETE